MLFFFYRTALENNVCYYILLLGRIFCAYDALFTFKIEHSILYIIYHVLARVDPSSTITKLYTKWKMSMASWNLFAADTHTHTRELPLCGEDRRLHNVVKQ